MSKHLFRTSQQYRMIATVWYHVVRTRKRFPDRYFYIQYRQTYPKYSRLTTDTSRVISTFTLSFLFLFDLCVTQNHEIINRVLQSLSRDVDAIWPITTRGVQRILPHTQWITSVLPGTLYTYLSISIKQKREVMLVLQSQAYA